MRLSSAVVAVIQWKTGRDGFTLVESGVTSWGAAGVTTQVLAGPQTVPAAQVPPQGAAAQAPDAQPYAQVAWVDA